MEKLVPGEDKPPALSPLDLQTDITELDIYGRMLGENRAKKLIGAELLPVKPCPYHDSRKGIPMNAEALEPLTREKESLYELLQGMRDALFPGVSRMLTVDELTTFAIAGEALPVFLSKRSKNPILPGSYPVAVSSVYKASAGVSSIALELRKLRMTERMMFTPELLYTFADNEGFLISDTEACAAPPPVIKETLKVMVEGSDIAVSARTMEVLGDQDAFRKFAQVERNVYQGLVTFFEQERIALKHLDATITNIQSKEQKAITLVQSVQQSIQEPDNPSANATTDSIAYYYAQLYRYTTLLNDSAIRINESLGRSTDVVPILTTDVERKRKTQMHYIVSQCIGRPLTQDEHNVLIIRGSSIVLQ